MLLLSGNIYFHTFLSGVLIGTACIENILPIIFRTQMDIIFDPGIYFRNSSYS